MMRATVFNYIECDYNQWRRHSACGGLSPEQFTRLGACHITRVGAGPGLWGAAWPET